MRTPRRYLPVNWVQWVTLALLFVTSYTTPILYLRIAHIQEHENDALQSIICYAEQRVRSAPSLTPQQRRQALGFYRQALTDAHLKPCTHNRKE